jgi:spore germination protein KC
MLELRGLNELSIVSGVAIDKTLRTATNMLSFEVVDLTKPTKETTLSAILLESEGKTLFDAARNAKKKVVNKLYFGHIR